MVLGLVLVIASRPLTPIKRVSIELNVSRNTGRKYRSFSRYGKNENILTVSRKNINRRKFDRHESEISRSLFTGNYFRVFSCGL